MKSDPLTADVSVRICKHMNNDHQEALISYARHYAGLEGITKARMITISSIGMELEVDEQRVQIPFDHQLIDSEDAHKTLVAMLRSIPK